VQRPSYLDYLGLAVTTATIPVGFWMMFLFGPFLSVPLALFFVIPQLAVTLDRLVNWLKQRAWLLAIEKGAIPDIACNNLCSSLLLQAYLSQSPNVLVRRSIEKMSKKLAALTSV